MGALTENSKRRHAVDLQLSSSSHPIFHLAAELSPPSKKIKLSSPPVVFCPITPLTQVAKTPTPPSRSFPPPAPLPRAVHAPQRILRAFGLGPDSRSRLLQSPLKPEVVDMGNFVSQFLRRKKASNFAPWRMGKRKDVSSPFGMGRGSEGSDGGHEGLGLDQYVQLVNCVKDGSLISETSHSNAVFPLSQSGLLDLTTVTEKPEETSNLHIVNCKVEDAKKLVLESTPANEGKVSVKRIPFYKELYTESARKYDSKLRSLDLEVELAEKKISSFHLANYVEEKNAKEDAESANATIDKLPESICWTLRERAEQWAKFVVFPDLSSPELAISGGVLPSIVVAIPSPVAHSTASIVLSNQPQSCGRCPRRSTSTDTSARDSTMGDSLRERAEQRLKFVVFPDLSSSKLAISGGVLRSMLEGCESKLKRDIIDGGVRSGEKGLALIVLIITGLKHGLATRRYGSVPPID
ncbi:uncharacterized protein LOC141826280 [Curcuma longa]|uniref:uncharacterized protein LOC141826280 n=1 Tax=Curcuma longa TaxID=136217 RepID=UPI003D9F550E